VAAAAAMKTGGRCEVNGSPSGSGDLTVEADGSEPVGPVGSSDPEGFPPVTLCPHNARRLRLSGPRAAYAPSHEHY
jgi:hypothetical protein